MDASRCRVVCRKSDESEIIRFPEGRTVQNGKIIPVVTIMYRKNYPYNPNCPNHETFEERIELDNDYYAWKDKKIKIRKMSHIRKESGYDPKCYDVMRYSFYYLEYN